MKISVIIPVYNVKDYLQKCLESVINQSYTNLEIILIDDGSKDSSGQICDEYALKDSKIKVIHQQNGGVSKARNKGLEYATGSLIGFVDPDDTIDSHMFEILLNNLQKNDADLSICSFERSDRTSKNNPSKITILNKENTLLNLLGDNKACGFIWNKLYKKEIIDKYSIKFNENITICEDLLFNVEYCEKINNSVYDTSRLYFYYIRPNSAFNGSFNEKWITTLDAYEQITKIFKRNNLSNCKELNYNILVANLDLKEKIFLSKYQNNNLIKTINNNIKTNYKLAIKSKKILPTIKFKLFIRKNFFKSFILIKKIKKSF